MSGQAAPAHVMAQTADQGCVAVHCLSESDSSSYVGRVCSGVLFKLSVFTAALAIAPLSSYYLSLNHIWNGKCRS